MQNRGQAALPERCKSILTLFIFLFVTFINLYFIVSFVINCICLKFTKWYNTFKHKCYTNIVSSNIYNTWTDNLGMDILSQLAPPFLNIRHNFQKCSIVGFYKHISIKKNFFINIHFKGDFDIFPKNPTGFPHGVFNPDCSPDQNPTGFYKTPQDK